MDKLTSTFPPKRCSQRHLEMISEFAERNGVNESEAMRLMIEIGHTSFTEEEKDLIEEYRKSNLGRKGATVLQSKILYQIFNITESSVGKFQTDINNFHLRIDEIFTDKEKSTINCSSLKEVNLSQELCNKQVKTI